MCNLSGKWIASALCVGAVITGLFGCWGNSARNAGSGPVRLAAGRPVVRDLAGGESHVYRFQAIKGQYLRLTLEQRGIDLKLRLLTPDGTLIREVDSPNGSWGPERASDVAKAAGEYQAEVQASEKAKPGSYELRIDGLRTATERDRALVEAEEVFHEGEALRIARDWKPALARYEELLERSRSLGDRAGEALALYRIGWMHQNLDDRPLALEKLSESISIYKETGDAQGEATALNRRGTILFLVERMDEALSSHERALQLSRSGKDSYGEATSLNNLGNVHSRSGRSGKAIEAYNAALPLWRKLDSRKNELSTLVNLGQLYLSQNQRQEARDTLEETIRAAEQLEEAETLSTALSSLGDLEVRDGRFDVARGYLERALGLQREFQDTQGQAVTLVSLGSLFLKAGELDRSQSVNQEALGIFRKLGDPQGEAIVLSHLGRIHAARKEDRQAVEKHHEARAVLERIGDRAGIASTRFGAAQSLARMGDFEAARRELEEGVEHTESLRAEASSLDFRAAYFASKQHYWDLYIDVLMRLAKQKPGEGFEALALAASERRRARSLLDALAETRMPDPGIEKEIQDMSRLLDLAETKRRQVMEKGDRSEIQKADRGIRTLLTRMDMLQAQSRERSARAADLDEPEPLNAREVQKLLDANTLLLVYSLGEARGFLWTVSFRRIDSYDLPGRAQVEAAARQVIDLIPRASQQAQAASARAAQRLSTLVLGPAAERIGSFNRLVIVGDGALQGVPFAALPDPGPQEGGGLRKSLLVERHEIVHLPSISVLAMLRRQSSRTRKPAEELRMAVIADPVFSAADPRVRNGGTAAPASPPAELTRAARDLGMEDLERLAYTRQEAASILGMVKGKPFSATGFEATRELLSSGRLRDYHIVHIATHSLMDSRDPDLSGIVFSLVDPQGKPRDGFLRLHDIYSLDLRARLVVLSACQTGVGKDLRGEGLQGITRGFMSAGVPQLVVSLWKVNDRGTAELMKRFYHQLLEEGLPPSLALQKAQVSMLRDPAWAHPRFWAGFIFQGDFHLKPNGDDLEEPGEAAVVKKAKSDLPPPKVAPDRPAGARTSGGERRE